MPKDLRDGACIHAKQIRTIIRKTAGRWERQPGGCAWSEGLCQRQLACTTEGRGGRSARFWKRTCMSILDAIAVWVHFFNFRLRFLRMNKDFMNCMPSIACHHLHAMTCYAHLHPQEYVHTHTRAHAHAQLHALSHVHLLVGKDELTQSCSINITRRSHLSM